MDLKFFNWSRGYSKAAPSATPALTAEYNGGAALIPAKHWEIHHCNIGQAMVPGPWKMLTYSEKGQFAAEDSL